MTRTRRRRARQGFTVLEVMMAVAVMLIGVMGIIALQRAILRANVEARMASTATTNSARWVATLRRSATQWVDASDVTGVPYLSKMGTGWFAPTATPGSGETEARGLDWYGRPTDDADELRYCTTMRLIPLVADRSIKAEIVTFWARSSPNAEASGAAGFAALCDDGLEAARMLGVEERPPSGGTPASTVVSPAYHAHRTSIVLRRARP